MSLEAIVLSRMRKARKDKTQRISSRALWAMGLDCLCLRFSSVYATFYDKNIFLKNEDINLFSGFSLAWFLTIKYLPEDPGYLVGNPWVANGLETSPAWGSHGLSHHHSMYSFLGFLYPWFSCLWFQTQPKQESSPLRLAFPWSVPPGGAPCVAEAGLLWHRGWWTRPLTARFPSVGCAPRHVTSNPCWQPGLLLFVLGMLLLSFSAVSPWASQMVRNKGYQLGLSDRPTHQEPMSCKGKHKCN